MEEWVVGGDNNDLGVSWVSGVGWFSYFHKLDSW